MKDSLWHTVIVKRSRQLIVVICFSLSFAVVTPACAYAQMSYGVNNPRLLTSPETAWKASLDSMAANGIHLVRTGIGKTTTAENMIAFLRYAQQLSIKVILIFPAQRDEFYPPGVPVQPFISHFYSGRGTAPVDISRFEAYWRAHREALHQAHVHVYAYELGNEMNGASFNRDYPVGSDARLLDLQACDGEQGCDTVRTGWNKYIAMLRTMRKDNLLDGTLLLGGSFVRVGENYVQHDHGSFSSVSSTRAYLTAHGADALVDAYTFHIYPVVPKNMDTEAGQKEIARQMNAAFTECRSNGARPCWVTEWGFVNEEKCQESPRQDSFTRDADAVFRQEASEQGGFEAIYYAWDTGDNRAAYDCGQVTSPIIAGVLKSR